MNRQKFSDLAVLEFHGDAVMARRDPYALSRGGLRREDDLLPPASAEREDEAFGVSADELPNTWSLAGPEEREPVGLGRVGAVQEPRQAHSLGLPPAEEDPVDAEQMVL